jgi:hypothetical protein
VLQIVSGQTLLARVCVRRHKQLAEHAIGALFPADLSMSGCTGCAGIAQDVSVTGTQDHASSALGDAHRGDEEPNAAGCVGAAISETCCCMEPGEHGALDSTVEQGSNPDEPVLLEFSVGRNVQVRGPRKRWLQQFPNGCLGRIWPHQQVRCSTQTCILKLVSSKPFPISESSLVQMHLVISAQVSINLVLNTVQLCGTRHVSAGTSWIEIREPRDQEPFAYVLGDMITDSRGRHSHTILETSTPGVMHAVIFSMAAKRVRLRRLCGALVPTAPSATSEVASVCLLWLSGKTVNW